MVRRKGSWLCVGALKVLVGLPQAALGIDEGTGFPSRAEPGGEDTETQRGSGQTGKERLVRERCGPQPDAEKAAKAKVWVEEAIRSDRTLRRAIVGVLQEGADPRGSTICRQVISEHLDELATTGQLPESDELKRKLREKRPFLFTALSAGFSRAVELMAEHLARDPNGEWLIALRSMDPDAYASTVQEVARRLADRLRIKFELPLQKAELYGRTRQNVFVEKSVRFKNPLIIHSFVSEWIERDQSPQPDDWSVMNVLYATMVQQNRTMVGQLLTNLIRKNDRLWIESLRREPVWVQYRLLSLAQEAGGAEVVRELMWITESHADEQMRLLASSMLDAVLSRAGKVPVSTKSSLPVTP